MSTPVAGQPIEPDQIREGMTIEARKDHSGGEYAITGGVVRAIPEEGLYLHHSYLSWFVRQGYTLTLIADVPRPDWRDAPTGSLWKDPETGDLYVRAKHEPHVFEGLDSFPLVIDDVLDLVVIARLVPVPGFVYDNGEWREGR